MAYFPFDLADMEFTFVLPFTLEPFYTFRYPGIKDLLYLPLIPGPAGISGDSTSHKGRPGDASFHAERGIKAVLLLQKASKHFSDGFLPC